MIDLKQYLENILRPTLDHLGMRAPAAEKLMMGTLAHESRGRFLRQVGGGPALGFFQIEPASHDDLHDNFLAYRSIKKKKLAALLAPSPGIHAQLMTNLAYSCAVARLIYYRRPEAMPSAGDIEGLAAYYKKWFNTSAGKATEEQWLAHYHEDVAPLF